MRAISIGSTVAALSAVLAGAGGATASRTSAAPGATICPAVPDGATLVVADASGVAIERAGGTERLSLPAFAAPPTLAVRGPDGTVWVEVPATPTETAASAPASTSGVAPSEVYRVRPGAAEAVRAATGELRLMSAGWLDGRTAAVVVDHASSPQVDEDSSGAVLVDFADGEQRIIGPAAGVEFGVNSATIGAGRVVEGAFADLTEAFTTSDAAGNHLDDWPSPISMDEYGQPPLHVWPVASVAQGTAAPSWAWVEAPDWDPETGQPAGGWALVVADAATGTESLRLDLATPGANLRHADFDGRFWVGTFNDDPDPADSDIAPFVPPPARVLVVDTAAAEPAVVDAGCPAGITATIDHHGEAAPPAAPPSTTAVPTTTTSTEPRCTYVEADDAYPLRKCDKGPAVRAIQEQINKRGQSIDVDGYFGPATEQAVRNFQQAAGLEVDGLVGPATWAALYTGDPAGTDADGNGTIEPWEITASGPASGGDAAP